MNSKGFQFSSLPYHQQVLCFENLPLRERLELLKVCSGLRRLVLCNGVFARRVEFFETNLTHGFYVQPIGASAPYGMLLAHRSLLSSIRHVRRLELGISESKVDELRSCLLNNLLHVDQLRLELAETRLPSLNLGGIRVSEVTAIELEIWQEVTTQTRVDLNHFFRDHLAACRFLRFQADSFGFEDIRESVLRWLPELRLLVLEHKLNLLKSIEEILENGLFTGVHEEKPVVLRQTFTCSITKAPYFRIENDVLPRYDQLEKILPNRELFDHVKDTWIDLKNKISDVVKGVEELIVFRTQFLPKNLLFVVYDPRECLVIQIPKNLITTRFPEESPKKWWLEKLEPVTSRVKDIYEKRFPTIKAEYYEDFLWQAFRKAKYKEETGGSSKPAEEPREPEPKRGKPDKEPDNMDLD